MTNKPNLIPNHPWIANRPDNPDWKGVEAWLDEIAETVEEREAEKPTVRPVFAFASKGKDGKPVVWIDPDYLAEQEDYERTIASLMIGIGRY